MVASGSTARRRSPSWLSSAHIHFIGRSASQPYVMVTKLLFQTGVIYDHLESYHTWTARSVSCELAFFHYFLLQQLILAHLASNGWTKSDIAIVSLSSIIIVSLFFATVFYCRYTGTQREWRHSSSSMGLHRFFRLPTRARRVRTSNRLHSWSIDELAEPPLLDEHRAGRTNVASDPVPSRSRWMTLWSTVRYWNPFERRPVRVVSIRQFSGSSPSHGLDPRPRRGHVRLPSATDFAEQPFTLLKSAWSTLRHALQKVHWTRTQEHAPRRSPTSTISVSGEVDEVVIDIGSSRGDAATPTLGDLGADELVAPPRPHSLPIDGYPEVTREENHETVCFITRSPGSKFSRDLGQTSSNPSQTVPYVRIHPFPVPNSTQLYLILRSHPISQSHDCTTRVIKFLPGRHLLTVHRGLLWTPPIVLPWMKFRCMDLPLGVLPFRISALFPIIPHPKIRTNFSSDLLVAILHCCSLVPFVQRGTLACQMCSHATQS